MQRQVWVDHRGVRQPAAPGKGKKNGLDLPR
jgi:hypothetical protein